MAGTSGVDATVFPLPVGQPALYAMPPVDLIASFVARLPAQSAVLLITPNWPKEIWCPRLRAIALLISTLPQAAVDLGPVGRPYFLRRKHNATTFAVWFVEKHE